MGWRERLTMDGGRLTMDDGRWTVDNDADLGVGGGIRDFGWFLVVVGVGCRV